MPNNDDLSRRLQLVEQQFGLVPRNTTEVTTNNDQPIQGQVEDNMNWKMLYKVLESEVEIIVLDPNAPTYVREWGARIMRRLAEYLPQRR
jgi:hypothetical protein|tara:strand:- start:1386 stop:1655 length:270 start_codon:yes stop_codon:yes gene_type:complete